MSRYFKLLCVIGILFAVTAQSGPVYKLTVTSVNPAVAVSSMLRAGPAVITCSTAAFINFGIDGTVTVTTSAYGAYFKAQESYVVYIRPGTQYLAVLAVAGTSACQVAYDA